MAIFEYMIVYYSAHTVVPFVESWAHQLYFLLILYFLFTYCIILYMVGLCQMDHTSSLFMATGPRVLELTVSWSPGAMAAKLPPTIGNRHHTF
jgi:hypothetical protein